MFARDSSVGRAVDCSRDQYILCVFMMQANLLITVINRSLVRFRFARQSLYYCIYCINTFSEGISYIALLVLPAIIHCQGMSVPWRQRQVPIYFIPTDTHMHSHQTNVALCPRISKNRKPYKCASVRVFPRPFISRNNFEQSNFTDNHN